VSAAPPRVLGLWTAVAIVMGNMIGSGVFLLPASLAAYRGLSIAGWLASAAGATLLALVFAHLAGRNPAGGGLYAYTREAFGDVPGFLVAWGYWLSTVATLPALAIAFVGYLDPFVPGVVRTPSAAAIVALGAMWLLIAINVAGVRLAGRVQVVTTALKIVPLLIVALGGLFYVRPEVFALPAASETPLPSQLLATVTLTLWAFLGLECATIPAGSIRDPARTIPRATVIGTTLTAVVYVLTTIGAMSLIAPEALATSTAPLADAAGRLFGGWGARLVALGAAISCFGALNGWVLISGQLPMAVAADGLFPRALGRLTDRGTPAVAMVTAGLLASALVGMNYTRGLVELFTFIILLSTLSTLVPYVFCALAVWALPGPPRRLGAIGPISALAFVYAMFAIAGAGADTVFYGFMLLLAGLPVYIWVRRS
jgi:APA family basic amino acid/polyamine antiporter